MDKLTRETLDSVRAIAKDWIPGVAIIKPSDGDFVFLAVSRIDMYSPSDHIHHTTIIGKDISLQIQQRFETNRLQGPSAVQSMIDNIRLEETWLLPPGAVFYWIKLDVTM